MKLSLAILALFLITSIPAAAQQAQRQDSFLDRMTGHWVLSGTIAGRQTTHDVDADWVLNREYIRLHETSREESPNGSPAYEAIVFIGWDKNTDEYCVLWLDTTSGTGLNSPVIGRGKLSGHQIAFLFKMPEGDFHTIFAYDNSSGTWKWIMDGEQNGKLSPFARVTLVRK